MQLRNARLCLDCEEIHDGAHCPVCASESFAFIRRWVPTPERRARPRDVEAPSKEVLDTYREMLLPDQKRPTIAWRLVRGGTVSLAVLGMAGWMLRRNSRSQNHASEKPESGEREKTTLKSL